MICGKVPAQPRAQQSSYKGIKSVKISQQNMKDMILQVFEAKADFASNCNQKRYQIIEFNKFII